MSRKKRLPKLPASPAPDWFDFRSGARPEIFSIEFVQGLARKFKIDTAKIPELKLALEGWADVYRVHKTESDDRPRPGQIKAELELIKSRIDALRSTLENLHPETEQWFWRPEAQIKAPLSSDEQVTKSPYGHTIFKIPTGPDQWVTFHIDQARHFESLTILGNYADAAIEQLSRFRPDRGGRIRSEALRMWVENVRAYWEKVLKRRFTAKKQGAAFCIAAFKPINPTFPESLITTAIRFVLEKPRKPKDAGTASK